MAEGYVDPDNHDEATVVKIPHDGHSGHEKLHDTLVLISLAFMVVSQIALYFWKQKSPRCVPLFTSQSSFSPVSSYQNIWILLVVFANFPHSMFVLFPVHGRLRPDSLSSSRSI
jgi:hypothetical protein